MRFALLFALTTIGGCGRGSEACISAKDAARTAWGEVSVRYGLALSAAEDALAEPTGRLAALERRPDAPAEGKAALAAEVAEKQAAVDALRPKVEAAQTASTAFAAQKASDARALAASMAEKLEGEDVAAALVKAEAAASACAGIE